MKTFRNSEKRTAQTLEVANCIGNIAVRKKQERKKGDR